MSKLPYIPDKKMYAAVMGACSYIRETGYFNKATQYYADKYNVDVEQVRKYVRIAQGNGQRKAAEKENRKYKWYVAIVVRDRFYPDSDTGRYASWDWTEDDFISNTGIFVKKATSAKNAEQSITSNNTTSNMLFVVHTDEFQTENEAKQFKENMTWDYAKSYVIN